MIYKLCDVYSAVKKEGQTGAIISGARGISKNEKKCLTFFPLQRLHFCSSTYTHLRNEIFPRITQPHFVGQEIKINYSLKNFRMKLVVVQNRETK